MIQSIIMTRSILNSNDRPTTDYNMADDFSSTTTALQIITLIGLSDQMRALCAARSHGFFKLVYSPEGYVPKVRGARAWWEWFRSFLFVYLKNARIWSEKTFKAQNLFLGLNS